LALCKNGLLSSFFVDSFLVIPRSGSRLSSYLESNRNLRDIYDKARPEDAFSFFKIVRKEYLLFEPEFSSYDYSEENLFFDSLGGKGELSIQAFPFFTNNLDKYFKLTFDDTRHTFSVEGSIKESDYEKRYLDCFNQAMSSNADICLFPEMSLSDDTLSAIKLCLQSLEKDDHRFFVAGSIWKQSANEGIILDSLGKEIVRQRKFTRFVYSDKDKEKDYTEDINIDVQKKSKISIIEVKGLGRVALLICKDVLIMKSFLTWLAVYL